MLIPAKNKPVEEIIEENYKTNFNKIPLPKIDETTFILQYNGLHPLDIILFILKNEKIKYLQINSFMISVKAVNIIKELKVKKYIQETNFSINSLILKTNSNISTLLKSENTKFVSSHMKLFLIETESNNYIIQSSGNFTFKYDIEFTTIQNNRNQFNILKNGKENLPTAN